jgi:PAS domain S-box-containing protein
MYTSTSLNTTIQLSSSDNSGVYDKSVSAMESMPLGNFAELALASADAGTFYIDLATDQIVYSPSLGRIMTGDERTDLTRNDLIEHVHPEDRALRERAYVEAAQTGHLDYEVRFVWKKDGSVHWARVVGRYLSDNTGKRVGFSGIALNTTTEKSLRLSSRSCGRG